MRWAQEYEIDYAASIEGVCIPAEWVRAAVDLDLPESGVEVAGYDVAEEGGDLNVFLRRRGPVVRPPESWGKQTTTQSAYRVVDLCRELGVRTVNYDCDGVGTGPKGIWAAMDELPFEAVPISGGATPSDLHWPDGRTSAQKFQNKRAELWWLLRRRFEKTYEYVSGISSHPADEMISLPNDPRLIAELSVLLVEYTDTGKIRMESKQRLRARGIKSPDFADALAYCFAPEKGWGFSGSNPEDDPIRRAPKGVFLSAPRETISLGGADSDDGGRDPDLLGMRF